MITKKQKLQALDESILLKEVMMILFSYKAGERTAEYVAEDIIYLVRESYKPTNLVRSDKNKQYKESWIEELKWDDGLWGKEIGIVRDLISKAKEEGIEEGIRLMEKIKGLSAKLMDEEE